MANIKDILHKRTIVSITVSLVLLIGTIYIISQTMVMGGFRALEEKFLQKNIARSQEVIEDRLNNLAIKLADWAIWDDTYAFIEDKNEAYIRSNLTSIALDTIKIDAMAFLNSRGKLVHAMSLDVKKMETDSLSEEFKRQLVPGSVLLSGTDGKGSATGIVMLRDRALLVASKPIVKSNGEGPSRGTIIFAKYLDSDELKHLGTLLGVSLDARMFEAASLPPGFNAAREAFLDGKNTFIKSFGTQTIAGYSFLKDLSGKPALILKVTVPREITQFGSLTMRYVFVALILVGAIFAMIVYVPLRREIAGKDQAEKVTEQEQLLNQATIESIPGTFYVIDESGRYVRWSAYQRDEIVGKPESQMTQVYAKDTIHPMDRQLVLEKIESVFKKGADEVVEGRVLMRGGPAFRWMVMTGRRMMIQGRPVLIGTGIDITERKNAEEALHVSKAKLDLAMKGAHMGVWEYNLAEGKRFFDQQTCALLGLDPMTFGGTNEEFFAVIHPEDREKVKGALARTVQRGVSYEPDYRVTWPDGSVHYVTSRGELVLDDKGNPGMVNGILWDITERKQAEDKIRDSEKFLFNIINAMADPIFVKDQQHRWLIVNDAFCGFMGHSREELIGKSDYDFFPKKEADVFWAKDEGVFETNKENTNEEEFTDAQGVTHVIVTKKTLHQEPQGQKILIGVIRDMTEIKKLENEMRKRLRELEIFYKASMGREERILELKRKVADLEERLNP